MLKCWEFFTCKKKECPVYESKDLKCWLISGTHCRDEIQGKFLEKMEICLACKVFKANMDATAMRNTIKVVNKQFKEFRRIVKERDKELESAGLELAIGLSEAFEGLKKISSGDPSIRIPEAAKVELIRKLKHMINVTAENIGEMVNQSHEFAIGLAEHFDVLHRVSKGELSARVSGESKVELLEALKKVINKVIESIDREITVRKQMENELRESEERYRRLFETSKDGILLLDKQTGNIININPAIVELLGYSSEQFIGKGLKDVGLLKDIDDVKEIIRKLDEAGFVYYDYVPVETKGGQSIDTEIYLIDRAKLIQCNVRNITDRKRAEKALERLRRQNEMILNSAGGGILGLDVHGNHIFVNPSAARMLGYEVEELIGKPSHPVWHHTKRDGSRYPGEECPIYMAYRKGIVQSVTDEIFWRKDGTSFPVEYTSTPIEEDGKFVGAVVTFKDISERKRTEEQIKQQLGRITALRNIDMAITASLDLRVTLNVFLEHVITQLNIDAATVLLLNPHTQTLEYGSGRGFRSTALKHTRLRLGEGHAGRAALERRIVSIPNLSEVENAFSRSPLLATEGFISYYAVPIIAKGNVKGVLEILHRTMLAPDQEWLDFLEALAIQAAIAIDNASLFDDLQRSNVELILAYDRTLEGWSKALDMRDKETEGHSQRVTDMTVKIARKMGVSDAELVHVRRGALLHDIGKMGIPDNILLKPGPLNDEEWKIMHKHPVFAYEMLSPITFLRPALDIPYYHHEKWDGTGYPHGLKGEQIPLAARIFAVVDVWDALRSPRPYRPAWAEEEVEKYMQDQAGKHFDPKIVEVFLKMKWQSQVEV